MVQNEYDLKKKGSSGTAEEIALHRAVESLKPEYERVCNDPYAFRFLSQDTRRFFDMMASGSEMAMSKISEMDILYPGTRNSIVARVRYIDDVVKSSIEGGITQLVILGAGYDTRAYRINGLKKLKVFEVDQLATQTVKIEKIKEIFGSLPDHVEYVAVNIGKEELGQGLGSKGFDTSKKTLFIMEGLIYYLEPSVVDDLLAFIVRNSAQGSAIVFDFFPRSMVEGTCVSEVGKRIYDRLNRYGEPLRFGIDDSLLDTFLAQRGFTNIKYTTGEEYRKTYFVGNNGNREICELYSFAYAQTK